MTRKESRLRMFEKEESSNDKDKMFVFQVIHDLRHPLEAQKAIIADSLDQIKRKTNYFQSWFDDNRKFKVRTSMRTRMDKMREILAGME